MSALTDDFKRMKRGYMNRENLLIISVLIRLILVLCIAGITKSYANHHDIYKIDGDDKKITHWIIKEESL